jgi:hypothetical protein
MTTSITGLQIFLTFIDPDTTFFGYMSSYLPRYIRILNPSWIVTACWESVFLPAIEQVQAYIALHVRRTVLLLCKHSTETLFLKGSRELDGSPACLSRGRRVKSETGVEHQGVGVLYLTCKPPYMFTCMHAQVKYAYWHKCLYLWMHEWLQTCFHACMFSAWSIRSLGRGLPKDLIPRIGKLVSMHACSAHYLSDP